jgi:hypothetical protein
VSDLHTECGYDEKLILPGGDLLLVAGDTVPIAKLTTVGQHYEHFARQGRSHAFFDLVDTQFRKYPEVLMIMGNHEHYRYDMEDSKKKLEELLAPWPYVRVLENEIVQIAPEWKLFAATLWTDYNSFSIQAMRTASGSMMDHYLISKKGYAFSPDDALHENAITKDMMKLVVDQNSNWIVMTHHTPSMRSGHPRWGGHGNTLNYAFHNTDLDEWILENPQIKFWVHGHTHDSCNYKLGETQVLCNPKGYGAENKGFDPSLQFEIE